MHPHLPLPQKLLSTQREAAVQAGTPMCRGPFGLFGLFGVVVRTVRHLATRSKKLVVARCLTTSSLLLLIRHLATIIKFIYNLKPFNPCLDASHCAQLSRVPHACANHSLETASMVVAEPAWLFPGTCQAQTNLPAMPSFAIRSPNERTIVAMASTLV